MNQVRKLASSAFHLNKFGNPIKHAYMYVYVGSFSITDKFKQFGHSDEDAALVEHVADKAQKTVDDGDDDDDDDDDDKLVTAHKKIYEKVNNISNDNFFFFGLKLYFKDFFFKIKDDTDQDDKTLGKAAAFEALKKYAKGK